MPTGKSITVIPATYHPNTHKPLQQIAKRRVAGYARVSTDSDEQFTSYAAQVDYYTQYIMANPEWEFVRVYTDEGISGTNTKHRDGFNTMIQDALAGKIDLIVIKSVSRFARNTVDSLTTIRKLKEHGTEVFFEKEAIWTFDSKGELLLTIMSSLAQEESRSISENVTWGQRKRFADGKVTMPYKHFLGYRKGADGQPEIDPEQAQIIRRIYRMFIEGSSVSRIAKTLTQQEVPTPAGKRVWQMRVVESILTNEKYKGDAVLQKTFTTDFLTKQTKINEGEVPQYYVTGSHPAIIEPGAWEQVQKELTRRKNSPIQRYCSSAFSGKIVCGDCGSIYGSKVWHSNDPYRKTVWQCNAKFKGADRCRTPHLSEEEIKAAFAQAVSTLIAEREQLFTDGRLLMTALADCTQVDKELQEIRQETAVVAGLIKQCIRDNAATAQNQDAYAEEYDSLSHRYASLEKRLRALQKERTEREQKAEVLSGFLFELGELEELNLAFKPQRWNAIVDHATIYRDGRMVFTFINGKEISIEIYL